MSTSSRSHHSVLVPGDVEQALSAFDNGLSVRATFVLLLGDPDDSGEQESGQPFDLQLGLEVAEAEVERVGTVVSVGPGKMVPNLT